MDLAQIAPTLTILAGVIVAVVALSRRGEESAGAANTIMRDTLTSALELFDRERDAWERERNELLTQIRERDKLVARLESDVKRMDGMLRSAGLL